ncbi:MAG: hypothetical protein AAGM38_14245 [Pseudomonadota bacterium]
MRAALLIALLVIIGLGAYIYVGQEEPGPGERLGEALDQTIEDAERRLEEATE